MISKYMTTGEFRLHYGYGPELGWGSEPKARQHLLIAFTIAVMVHLALAPVEISWQSTETEPERHKIFVVKHFTFAQPPVRQARRGGGNKS